MLIDGTCQMRLAKARITDNEQLTQTALYNLSIASKMGGNLKIENPQVMLRDEYLNSMNLVLLGS